MDLARLLSCRPLACASAGGVHGRHPGAACCALYTGGRWADGCVGGWQARAAEEGARQRVAPPCFGNPARGLLGACSEVALHSALLPGSGLLLTDRKQLCRCFSSSPFLFERSLSLRRLHRSAKSLVLLVADLQRPERAAQVPQALDYAPALLLSWAELGRARPLVIWLFRGVESCKWRPCGTRPGAQHCYRFQL